MDVEGSRKIQSEQQKKKVPLFFSGVWKAVDFVGVRTMPRETHERPLHQQFRLIPAN